MTTTVINTLSTLIKHAVSCLLLCDNGELKKQEDMEFKMFHIYDSHREPNLDASTFLVVLLHVFNLR